MTNEELIKQGLEEGKDVSKEILDKNEGFIRYTANKYNNESFDDICSIARIGFLKALKSYDVDKGFKFITFASRCMLNEINMYVRQEKKHKDNISMNMCKYRDKDGSELTLEDILSSNDNIEADFMDKFSYNRLTEIIKGLSVKDKEIIRLKLKGLTQREIGERLGATQSFISRLIRDIYKRILLKVKIDERKENHFSMGTNIKNKEVREGHNSMDMQSIGKAFYIFDKFKGKVNLRVLAGFLNKPEGTVRGYKVKYTNEKYKDIPRVPIDMEAFEDFLIKDVFSSNKSEAVKEANLNKIKSEKIKGEVKVVKPKVKESKITVPKTEEKQTNVSTKEMDNLVSTALSLNISLKGLTVSGIEAILNASLKTLGSKSYNVELKIY